MIRSVFMRYPEGKAKAVTFSYDDGILSDKRLADLLADYGMKATFNFSNCAERPAKFSAEELRAIFLDRGHEIAVHGANHRANGNTRPIEGIRDVLECRLYLESACDRLIRGMAYPDSGITRMGNFGSYGAIKQYLTELDIVYARTLGGDNDSFRLPDDFHAWMPTAHHDNPEIMAYVEKFLALDLSPRAYHASRYPRLFYVWGHTFEFDRKNNWDHIEAICKKFDSARKEIWFATNMEIYDYVQAYKGLIWSADGYKVCNPTLLPVWIDVDGVLYRIASGETVRIEEVTKK